MDHLNSVHHIAFSVEPPEFSSQPISTYSVANSTTTTGYSNSSNSSDLRKPSSWPSPPIYYVVTQDSSTQTDNITDASFLSKLDTNDKKSNKHSLLSVKRSASFGDQRKERSHKNGERLVLSRSSSSLRRDMKNLLDDHSVQEAHYH